MRHVVLATLVLLVPSVSRPAPAQERTAAWQVAAAVLPLPDSMRAGARVLGYAGTKLTELRPGRNEMVCLADDPAQKGFQASCYHRSLEPFMARGRSLRAAGVTERHAIDSLRLAEIKSGRLVMPKTPAALYSLFADVDTFDALAGPPPDNHALIVIYMPYATTASSGVPTVPAKGRPFLMYAGMPWAHLMIQP